MAKATGKASPRTAAKVLKGKGSKSVPVTKPVKSAKATKPAKPVKVAKATARKPRGKEAATRYLEIVVLDIDSKKAESVLPPYAIPEELGELGTEEGLSYIRRCVEDASLRFTTDAMTHLAKLDSTQGLVFVEAIYSPRIKGEQIGPAFKALVGVQLEELATAEAVKATKPRTPKPREAVAPAKAKGTKTKVAEVQVTNNGKAAVKVLEPVKAKATKARAKVSDVLERIERGYLERVKTLGTKGAAKWREDMLAKHAA